MISKAWDVRFGFLAAVHCMAVVLYACGIRMGRVCETSVQTMRNER
jgi:hypothetical protein